MPFVIDNTNLTRAERSERIRIAKAFGFEVVGYYFQSKIQDAIKRNSLRLEAERVPDVGIFGASGRLEIPRKEEGFSQLFYVRMNAENDFEVEEWKDEI